jgi:hypothetical protein
VIRRLSLAAVFLLLVVSGVLAHGPVIVREYINGDTLYSTAFYRDIFVDGYGVTHWDLKPAPQFFPDLPLAFAVLWAAGSDLGIAYVVFSVVWILLMLLCLMSVAVHRRISVLLRLCAGAFHCLAAEPRCAHVAQHLSAVHHRSAFSSASFSWIVLGGIRWGLSPSRWAALFLISTATVISEFLIVPWFLLPVSLTAIVFSALGWLPARTCLLLLLAVAGACGAAFASVSALRALGIFDWNFPWIAEAPLAGSIHSFANPDFRREWLSLGERFPVLGGVAAVWLLVCSGFLAREIKHLASSGGLRRISTRERLELFLIVFSLFSVSAAILGPISKGWSWVICLRHLHPVFLLPGMLLATVIAVPRYRGSAHVNLGLCGLIALFASFEIAPRLVSPRWKRARSDIPIRTAFDASTGSSGGIRWNMGTAATTGTTST